MHHKAVLKVLESFDDEIKDEFPTIAEALVRGHHNLEADFHAKQRGYKQAVERLKCLADFVPDHAKLYLNESERRYKETMDDAKKKVCIICLALPVNIYIYIYIYIHTYIILQAKSWMEVTEGQKVQKCADFSKCLNKLQDQARVTIPHNYKLWSRADVLSCKDVDDFKHLLRSGFEGVNQLDPAGEFF